MASPQACRPPEFVDSQYSVASTTVGIPPPSKIAVLDGSSSFGADTKKVGKKRSRASRRPPITILEADCSNFRAMVQQLTGISSSLQRRRFVQLPPPAVSFPRHSSVPGGSSMHDPLLHSTDPPPLEILPSSFLFKESSEYERLDSAATKLDKTSEASSSHTDPLSVFQSLGYSYMASSLLSSLDHAASPYLGADESQLWDSRADLSSSPK